MTSININKNKLKELKEIGNGTEGRVFKYDNEHLIKLYRSELKNLLRTDNNYNNYIKIHDKNNLKFDKNLEYISYFLNNDDKNLRIINMEKIKMAIKKQNNINRTSLPIDIVYIDGYFAGCLLKKLNGVQIHKLSGMPIKYKKKIIKNLLLDIEELLENYIYHTDLANSPYSVGLFMDETNNVKAKKGHSHVLVNPVNLKTNIIDLDGKSTAYTEKYSYQLEQKCLNNLTRLITEFLFKLDTDEIKEIDELEFELLKLGLQQNIAYKFSNHRFESINELKKELKL